MSHANVSTTNHNQVTISKLVSYNTREEISKYQRLFKLILSHYNYKFSSSRLGTFSNSEDFTNSAAQDSATFSRLRQFSRNVSCFCNQHSSFQSTEKIVQSHSADSTNSAETLVVFAINSSIQSTEKISNLIFFVCFDFAMSSPISISNLEFPQFDLSEPVQDLSMLVFYRRKLRKITEVIIV